MDPHQIKHVTKDNVVSEDIKPEGRTDGPKNFGPEYVTRGDGRVVPTRPNEQIERTARAMAEGARAEGKSEAEVARSFAGSLGDDSGAAAIPASAQPVPDVVLGSMSAHAREEHLKKNGGDKKQDDPREVHDQMQYDLGVSLAQDNKACPLEAHSCLEEGYNDTREAMKKQLQDRRERESATDQSAKDKNAAAAGDVQTADESTKGYAEGSAEARDYAKGAEFARGGKTLPSGAPKAAQEGYDSVPEAERGAKDAGTKEAKVKNPHSPGSKKHADFEAGVMFATEGKPLPSDAPAEAKEGYEAAQAATKK